MAKTLDELTNDGYATSSELKNANGIKKKWDLGYNEFLECNDYVIIDTNDRQWDYMSEDGIYELQPETKAVYLRN